MNAMVGAASVSTFEVCRSRLRRTRARMTRVLVLVGVLWQEPSWHVVGLKGNWQRPNCTAGAVTHGRHQCARAGTPRACEPLGPRDQSGESRCYGSAASGRDRLPAGGDRVCRVLESVPDLFPGRAICPPDVDVNCSLGTSLTLPLRPVRTCTLAIRKAVEINVRSASVLCDEALTDRVLAGSDIIEERRGRIRHVGIGPPGHFEFVGVSASLAIFHGERCGVVVGAAGILRHRDASAAGDLANLEVADGVER